MIPQLKNPRTTCEFYRGSEASNTMRVQCNHEPEKATWLCTGSGIGNRNMLDAAENPSLKQVHIDPESGSRPQHETSPTPSQREP